MDRIRIRIKEDGELLVVTEGVSAENHVSADCLLSTLAALAGGSRSTEEREHHGHTHAESESHVHH